MPRLSVNDDGATYFPMLVEQGGEVIAIRPATDRESGEREQE
jgi:hypothetical protein